MQETQFALAYREESIYGWSVAESGESVYPSSSRIPLRFYRATGFNAPVSCVAGCDGLLGNPHFAFEVTALIGVRVAGATIGFAAYLGAFPE